MKTLLLIEHDHTLLKPVNRHVLTAAKKLSDTIDVLIIGHQCERIVEQAQKLPGIQKIRVADASEYAYQLAENTASLVNELGTDYDYILAPATTYGKNLLPRVAALLDVDMLSDVIAIDAPDCFQRPIYAGNAIATVKTQERIKLLTIRATAFPALAIDATTTAVIENIATRIPNKSTQFVEQQLTVSERPELTAARVIVSGGRGLKSAENFKLLETFADSIGAAIGASRAAVDAGFAPNDYQVGQTGKVVAPDLYIAIGISGAIQHLAGMKDSKVIVAINSDPDAAIFQVADYGLVGDLFTLLPELQTELQRK